MFQHTESPLAPAVPYIRGRGHDRDLHLVTPELFRERVEAEVVRHARYLSGAGILRIGPRRGRLGGDALREAAETETRRTDSVCSYPDGSQAVLAVNADRRAVESLGRRIERVARDIAREKDGSCPDFVSGLAVADDRRLQADELWMAANNALEVAHDTGSDVAVAGWE